MLSRWRQGDVSAALRRWGSKERSMMAESRDSPDATSGRLGSWMAKNPYTEDRFMDRYLKGTVGYGYEEGCIDQAKALVAWGEERCLEHQPYLSRRECFMCWQRLKLRVATLRVATTTESGESGREVENDGRILDLETLP